MFHNQENEFVTCPSCEFRYPLSRGACMMCGTPPPPMVPTSATSEAVPASREADRAPEGVFSPSQPRQPVEATGSGKSIGMGIAVAVVLLVPVFLVIQHWQTSRSNGPLASATSIQPQSISEEVPASPRVAGNRAKKTHSRTQVKQEPEATDSAVGDNPAELWKNVRAGSARAEVTLAKLYLEGNEVPQSCEQTHMLLLAASKKGYKAADNMLSGAYVERCRQNSAQ